MGIILLIISLFSVFLISYMMWKDITKNYDTEEDQEKKSKTKEK